MLWVTLFQLWKTILLHTCLLSLFTDKFHESWGERAHVIMQVSQNPTFKRNPEKLNIFSPKLCWYACLVLYILSASVKLTEETKEWDTFGKTSSNRFKPQGFQYVSICGHCLETKSHLQLSESLLYSFKNCLSSIYSFFSWLFKCNLCINKFPIMFWNSFLAL